MGNLMKPMNVFCYFFGFACGATVMYFTDPRRGRRRRALVRDKAVSLAHQAQDYAGKQARHLTNRIAGLAHELPQAVTGQGQSQGQGGNGRQRANATHPM